MDAAPEPRTLIKHQNNKYLHFYTLPLNST